MQFDAVVTDSPTFSDPTAVLVQSFVTGQEVDRANLVGWVVNPKVATRLVAAVRAGVVFSDCKVATDVYGKTYVRSNCLVFGKTLNKDLTKLGF